MFYDRDGNLTDDTDRCVSGTMDEFNPGDDYDPMYEECRKCDSPNRECKPYGFGIETFDSPEWAEARRHFERMRSLVFGLPSDAHSSMDYGHWLRAWAIKAGWCERRYKRSDRLWDRLCDTCETHTEAVERYERWAKRVTKAD